VTNPLDTVRILQELVPGVTYTGSMEWILWLIVIRSTILLPR
jgi:hypothetical protein